MANRMSDLNRQKRNFAYSGQADTGDIPWLYEIAAQQAAGNQPAGIGQQGGGMDDGAAANPQDLGGGGVGGGTGGGGASGGADVGLQGPGITGGGEELDNLYRMWERGGQHGEGVGLSDAGYADPGGFATVGSIGGPLTGIPGLGVIGAGISAAYDYDLANQFDPNYDGSFGSFLSSLGHYATGGALGGTQLGEAIDNYQDATGTGLNDPSLAAGVTGGGYSGPKGVVGPQASGGGAETGSSGGGLNAAARSAYSGGAGSYSGPKGVSGSSRNYDHSEARRGGGGGGGGAEGNHAAGSTGAQTGGGFGVDRGQVAFHTGGYVSEDSVPGQVRGDVSATLQEGEGVISADAMEALGGPGFVHGINMMARMMRGRR